MVCTKSDCYLRITGYIGLTRGIIQHQLHRLGLSSVSLQEQKQNLLKPTPTYFFKWHRNIPLLISGAVLFLLSYLLYTPSTTDRSSALKNFEAVLHKKELQVEQELILLSAHASNKTYTQLFSEKPEYYNELYREFGYVLLIYENDTLKFWTDNSPAVENQMKTVCLDDRVAKLHNGWFEVIHSKSAGSGKSCIGLFLIKNDYPYQNNYLINGFQKQFSLPPDVKLIKGSTADTFAVHDRIGKYLFTLEFAQSNEEGETLNIGSMLLRIIGLSLFVIGLLLLFITGENKLYNSLFFITGIVLLRFLSIKFRLPAMLYSSPLFSPQYYGDATTFWLPSLGDLLLNTLCMLAIGLHLNLSATIKTPPYIIKNKLSVSAVLLLALFSTSLIINKFFISLVANSSIPFNINNIFSLTGFSYIGFVIIALMLLAFFFITNRIVYFVNELMPNRKSFAVVFFSAAIVFSVICHLIGYVDWIFIAMPFIITLSIYILRNKFSAGYSFPNIVFIVFLFSIYSVHTFSKEARNKERDSRKVIAEKLAADKDPLTEHLFSEVETKLAADSVLINYISQPVKDINAFEKRLRQDYFGGYWDKYNIKFTMFDTACRILLKPPGSAADNNTYYDDIIAREGQETTSPYFYFLKNNSGKISYMAKLPLHLIKGSKRQVANLYAELDTRFLPEEIGFPELLIDRSMGIDRDLLDYSYAKYKNNSLISQYGKIQFGLTPEQFIGNTKDFTFVEIDGYEYLSYSPNSSTIVVIANPAYSLFDTITYFSYLFSFFSVVVLAVIIIRQVMRGSVFGNNTFKYRIQFLLVLIVLISLALFGTGTIFYIKQQYEIKNRESINEKINSVAVELENKLGNEQVLNAGFRDYTNYLLKKLSSVFFTDINIYDPSGNIYASSQPKIFEEGLASTKMNPEAYLQMAIRQKTQFIHDEEIGNLEYLSAYVPFKGKDNKLIAYLSLPYFAKQSELEKEIAAFLVALINIYVLLFALSVLMAIFIANYVTRPLKLIQDKIGKIRLGKINDPIEWNDNDEIGNLVKEYNRMIMELTKSAELLAKSERESAWREMAKQVAHEIKNPLTPMKLSVQHLQRMWNDKDPEIEQKLQRITNTLIEQIDTLSSIASAFSSFAKMPKPTSEKVDLDAVLQNTISLFKEIDGTTINYTNHLSEKAFVFADKEQLLRVFNNLVKNALQCIPESRRGQITVSLNAGDIGYTVTVNDNGSGISKEVAEKIFTPNFTTKSTGMGLGLVMAKNIVENFDGKIWFTTEEEKGSAFYVELPKYNSV